MPTRKKRFNGPVFTFTALVLCVIAYQAYAIRAVAMMQPTVIATVDREGVFKQLAVVGVAYKKLENEIQVLKESNKTAKDSITALRADQEDFPPGGQKFEEIEDRLLRASFEFSADVDYINSYRERRSAEIASEIYLKISDAAKEIAVMKGVDIVIVDDSTAPFTNNPNSRVSREVQILQQIAARRIMYANPMIDITQDLIVHMNNANDADLNP